MRRQILKLLAALLALTAITSHALADLRLGQMGLGRGSGRTLVRTEVLSSALANAGFLAEVGGVAFDREAQPADGLSIEGMTIWYDSKVQDGWRLAASINGQRGRGAIYDWQLIPVAKYVDSGDTGCFTLFGSLRDQDEQRQFRQRGAKFFPNYAKSFQNTLLGLRLLQLDGLIVGDFAEDFAVDLPRDDGQYVLGRGEDAPNIDSNKWMLAQYQDGVARLRRDLKAQNVLVDYKSYVICDWYQDIRFNLDDGRLNITGEPFYYFWTINDAYQSRLHAIPVDVAKQMHILQPADPQSDSMSVFGTHQQLEDWQRTVDSRVRSEVKVTYLRAYSGGHARLVDQLARVNPPVWEAGRNVMRYSALFRYCKRHLPQTWKSFIAQINNLDIAAAQPAIVTPSVLLPPQQSHRPD